MSVRELINALSQHDPEMEVCVFDYKKNINDGDHSEGAAGVYQQFYVEEIPAEPTKFVAISFNNPEEDD